MKPISQRHKILGGVFLIIGVVWSMDMLTGGPTPDPANAAQNSQVSVNGVPMPAEPADLDTLITQITRPPANPAPLYIDPAARDLFFAVAGGSLDPSQANEPTNEAESALEMEGRQAPSNLPRELQGIIEGRVPLALVDGRLLRLGSKIEDYRLVEIQRDFVVFEREGERYTLRLAGIGKPEK